MPQKIVSTFLNWFYGLIDWLKIFFIVFSAQSNINCITIRLLCNIFVQSFFRLERNPLRGHIAECDDDSNVIHHTRLHPSNPHHPPPHSSFPAPPLFPSSFTFCPNLHYIIQLHFSPHAHIYHSILSQPLHCPFSNIHFVPSIMEKQHFQRLLCQEVWKTTCLWRQSLWIPGG